MPAKRTPAPETTAPEATRPACLCGCGGYPKRPTSKFVVGHDAKLASAKRKAKAAEA